MENLLARLAKIQPPPSVPALHVSLVGTAPSLPDVPVKRRVLVAPTVTLPSPYVPSFGFPAPEHSGSQAVSPVKEAPSSLPVTSSAPPFASAN